MRSWIWKLSRTNRKFKKKNEKNNKDVNEEMSETKLYIERYKVVDRQLQLAKHKM